MGQKRAHTTARHWDYSPWGAENWKNEKLDDVIQSIRIAMNHKKSLVQPLERNTKQFAILTFDRDLHHGILWLVPIYSDQTIVRFNNFVCYC